MSNPLLVLGQPTHCRFGVLEVDLSTLRRQGLTTSVIIRLRDGRDRRWDNTAMAIFEEALEVIFGGPNAYKLERREEELFLSHYHRDGGTRPDRYFLTLVGRSIKYFTSTLARTVDETKWRRTVRYDRVVRRPRYR